MAPDNPDADCKMCGGSQRCWRCNGEAVIHNPACEKLGTHVAQAHTCAPLPCPECMAGLCPECDGTGERP